MTKTAALSRAYAALRQLELLRQQDILDPLPLESDTDASSSAAAPQTTTTSGTTRRLASRGLSRQDALQRILRDMLMLRRQAEGKPPSSHRTSPHTSEGREEGDGRDDMGEGEVFFDDEPSSHLAAASSVARSSGHRPFQNASTFYDAPLSPSVEAYTNSLLRGSPHHSPTPQKPPYQPMLSSSSPLCVTDGLASDGEVYMASLAAELEAATSHRDASLLPFVRRVLTAGSVELQHELQAMEERRDCRDWFALAALLNAPAAAQYVLVPLLLAELAMQKKGDGSSRQVHILCALIGLGEVAVDALPSLVEMLLRGDGDAKLVALAIRAVGGDEGISALCRIAGGNAAPHSAGANNIPQTTTNATTTTTSTNKKTSALVHANTVAKVVDPTVRAAAMYGVSLLARPVLGHTTASVVAGLHGRVAFYQPAVKEGYKEMNRQQKQQQQQQQQEPCISMLQRPPPYRPTHIIMDAEDARRRLFEFATSRAFRRGPTNGYGTLPFILSDMAHDAPEACQKIGAPSAVLEILASLSAEVQDLDSSLPPRVLPFAYDPHFIGCEDELFAIEEAFMSILLGRRTPRTVVEQTLVSIASMPNFATLHVVHPVLDFVIESFSQFECDGGAGLDGPGEEAVVVAGLVAIGRLVHSDATPSALTDAASDLLLRALASPHWKVRHAACIGLGEVGPMSNRIETTVCGLSNCLGDTGVHDETVTWALARVGRCGVAALLDSITNKELPVPTRVVAVRALVQVDPFTVCLRIAEEAFTLRAHMVQCLSEAITMVDGLEEEVILECAYTLGAFIAQTTSNPLLVSSGSLVAHTMGQNVTDKIRKQKLEEDDTEEAAVYYRDEEPNEAYEIIKSVLDSVMLPFSVQQALFFAICAHGGPHGEVYASETVIQSPDVTARAASAFGLRACGGKVIRTLVMALNDDSAEVRCEAFDTLDYIGAEPVLSVLRRRPRQHTQQVIAALRDCLLRDMNRNTKRQVAQDIYTLLARTKII